MAVVPTRMGCRNRTATASLRHQGLSRGVASSWIACQSLCAYNIGLVPKSKGEAGCGQIVPLPSRNSEQMAGASPAHTTSPGILTPVAHDLDESLWRKRRSSVHEKLMNLSSLCIMRFADLSVPHALDARSVRWEMRMPCLGRFVTSPRTVAVVVKVVWVARRFRDIWHLRCLRW